MEPIVSLHGLRYQRISEKRTGPGVLILSGTSSSQFMNRRGWQLIQDINRAHSVERGGLFPRTIVEIYSDLQRLALEHTERDWERLEVRRIAGRSVRPVLLRGFAIPGPQDQESLLVIILMERVRYRERNLEGVDHLGLTDREYEVVRNLVKGWTNKEIARELAITEQTVKAHVRQIMMRMGVTTRTGILSKLLATGPDYPMTAHRVTGLSMPAETASHAAGRRVANAGPAPLP